MGKTPPIKVTGRGRPRETRPGTYVSLMDRHNRSCNRHLTIDGATLDEVEAMIVRAVEQAAKERGSAA